MHPTVRTFMDTDTHALRMDDDIVAAVGHLIDEKVTGAPVVDDGGTLVGVLGEYECLKVLTEGDRNADLPAGKVRDFMRRDIASVTPDMDIYYVAGRFLADPTTRRFPVVAGGRLVGVVTRKDILRAIRAASFPADASALRSKGGI